MTNEVASARAHEDEEKVMLKLLALVSEVDSIPMEELTRVAAALQKQASRDLRPAWEVEAAVSAFARV